MNGVSFPQMSFQKLFTRSALGVRFIFISFSALNFLYTDFTPYNGSRLNGTATSGLEGRVPQLQRASHTASKSLFFSFVLDTFQGHFLNSTNTRSRISDLSGCVGEQNL